MFYITLYNENYEQPPMREGVEQGIIDGIYKFADAPEGLPHSATLLFSGTAHSAARAAQRELADRYGVAAELWSVTSYGRLRDEALQVERWNRLHPTAEPRRSLIERTLAEVDGPVVAVSDYMRAVPEQILPWAPPGFTALGTDGYGRSDTREALRRFFEVDREHIVVAALSELGRSGEIEAALAAEAIAHYDLEPDTVAPWHADD
jgi:pyruvate dehydrogenase E1 component